MGYTVDRWATSGNGNRLYCLYLFPCLYLLKVHAHCPGSTPPQSELSVYDSELVGFASC